MGHLMFTLSVVAACLLWTATCTAAAARTERAWLRRLLVAIGVILPPVALLPWVALTAWLAFGLKLQTNWFAATVTVLVSALVGGGWIGRAGLSRPATGAGRVAAAWPAVGLAAMFVMAKAVAFGTLLFIDNAVAAEGRALRVEAAQIMATSLPPQPAADGDAAPLYLRAFAAIAADRSLHDQESPLRKAATTDVATPEVAEILARHATTLDLLRRAADKPGCRFVRDWSRPSFDMLLPEMQEMRHGARLLGLAARREAADGAAAAALADVMRMHRIGMHAAADPILISGLVGQAIDSLAIDALAAVLPQLRSEDLPLLDGPGLRDFLGTTISYQRHFLGEEAFGLATVADLADGRIGGSPLELLDALRGGGTRAPFLAEPLFLLFRCFLLPSDVAGYRSIMGRYRQLAASGAAEKTFPEIKKLLDDAGDEERLQGAGIFTRLTAPALAATLRNEAKARALHRAAEVLVAATRVRLASGALPESAAALVPGGLAALPRDPFTREEPLLAKRSAESFLVYSVGPDGEDDGGPPPGGDTPPGNDDIGLRLAL